MKSKFSFDQLLDYAFANHRYYLKLTQVRPEERAKGINNPEGWATTALRTGEWDSVVEEFLENPNMYDRVQ